MFDRRNIILLRIGLLIFRVLMAARLHKKNQHQGGEKKRTGNGEIGMAYHFEGFVLVNSDFSSNIPAEFESLEQAFGATGVKSFFFLSKNNHI